MLIESKQLVVRKMVEQQKNSYFVRGAQTSKFLGKIA